MAISQSLKNLFGIKDSLENKPAVQVNNTVDKVSEPTTPVATSELEHINQEMYKKSAELSERNKTLSLLQKINELILGSITHPDEIARQVVSLLVTEIDFTIVGIYQHDKPQKLLKLLACAKSDQQTPCESDATMLKEIRLSDTENIIAKAVTERQITYTANLQNVFAKGQKVDDVKSIFISHMYVRNELIGAIVIGMSEEEQALSEYRRYLLVQLAELVGIGIDNALLYNEVQITNQRLKDLDKLKDEFVSVASHELRTPMTAIKSYLWMALEGKGGALNEKQHYYIERGYNSVDRLIRLVNDMLNISRIESGKVTVLPDAIDLVKLTREVVEEVLPRAQEVGVAVLLEPSDHIPPVLADSDKIKEVLFNLIGNSFKFTPREGRVTIKFLYKDGFVQTMISDTGSGIESDDIGKLFQKFGLLPGSYTTNQPSVGTGLGLFISRSIIDLHGGKIWAESEGRGKGATFSFLLKEFTEADKSKIVPKTDERTEDSVGLIHSEM